jgi:hypothetical protein
MTRWLSFFRYLKSLSYNHTFNFVFFLLVDQGEASIAFSCMVKTSGSEVDEITPEEYNNQESKTLMDGPAMRPEAKDGIARVSASTASTVPAIPAGQAASAHNCRGISSQNVGVNGQTSSTWQTYRQSRLSTLAKWIYILMISLFLVALYCGDFSSQQRTHQVLPRITKKVALMLETYSQQLDALGLPRIDMTQVWNGLADKAPARFSVLQPLECPALARGTVMHAGDYIYACVEEGGNAGKECNPTFFHLKDDGSLLLARGTTPKRAIRTIWKSKAGPVKHGKYVATYGENGALEVYLGEKRIWRARKFFQPRVLRPWPLTK